MGVKPKAELIDAPPKKKTMELISAVDVAFFATAINDCGCISSPKRNSKKIMPMWPLSSSRVISVIKPAP